jgi:hypothetical protein
MAPVLPALAGSIAGEKSAPRRPDPRHHQGDTMIRPIILALLATAPAHADTWCPGILTSNNVCESNVPTVIIRCNYYDNNSDPRCVASVINVILSIGERRNRHRPADMKNPSPTARGGAKWTADAHAGRLCTTSSLYQISNPNFANHSSM